MPMMTLEKTKATVAELRAKLDEIETRALVLNSEREQISFAALAEGDKVARDRLAQVNTELSGLEGKQRSLEAAISEGEKRVAAAMTEANAAGEAARAKKALALGKQMRDQAKALDKHMAAMFEGFAEIRCTMTELSHMGAGPNVRLVDLACLSALKAASMKSRTMKLEHCPLAISTR